MYELFIDSRNDWGNLEQTKLRSFKKYKTALKWLVKWGNGHIQFKNKYIAIAKEGNLVFNLD